MPVKTMIVDDEPYVRKDIRYMLSKVKTVSKENEIEIVCEAGTVEAAKKFLLENSLDLIFLDIQLRGGTGFDLIPYIDESVEIIFITAYDEYAVRAFEINALDYILKPVTADRLSQTLMRLQSRSPERDASEKQLPFSTDDRVFIKTDTNRLFIAIDKIVAISSIGGNYAVLVLKNGEKQLSRKTIKAWESLLPEEDFIRIHRATIINIRFIKQIEYQNDRTCAVTQVGHEKPFMVSRRMGVRFKTLIKQNAKLDLLRETASIKN